MGWASKYEKTNGAVNWYAHWRDEHGKHRSKPMGQTSRQEALEYAAARDAEVRARKGLAPIPTDEALDAFLLHSADSKSEATVDLYRRFLGPLLNAWRGRSPVDWSEDAFREYIRAWNGKPAAQWQITRAARQFIAWAAAGKGRPKVPDFVGAYRPPRAAERHVVPLTRSQRLTLLDAARGHELETAVALAVGMGLRPKEWRAAQGPDLIAAERKLRVHRKGFRDQFLPIPPTVLEVLERTNLRPWLAGEAVDLSPAASRGRLGTLCRAAEVPETSWYGLRHTALTLLAERQPLHVVQRFAGHTTLKSTQVYLHAQEHHLRAAADEDL